MVNIALLKKYIDGEYIDESKLLELENDSEFMTSVITLSNDKNIYNLCSLDVKKDYNFVMLLINKFKNDKEFICNVANYYLDNSEDNTKKFELSIIMSDILKNDSLSSKYDDFIKRKYYEIKTAKDNYLKKNPGKERIAGVGFIYMDYLYYSSNIVMNYCAKKFIEELIDSKKFVSYIHKNFNSYEEFEKNMYLVIIKYIDMFDYKLANYIRMNISVLNSLDSSLLIIKRTWNKYTEIQDEKKYYYMFNEIQYYMMEHDYGQIGEYLMIHYIARKMGILDKVVKYTKFDYNEVVKQLDKLDLESIISNSIPDKINYEKCREIINNMIFNGNLDYDYHEAEKEKVNCRIISFNKQG